MDDRVPNEDKRKFRDMTPEERAAIIEAAVAGNMEWVWGGDWTPTKADCVLLDAIYRTRSRKTVVHWDRLPRTMAYVALDSLGTWLGFKGEPEKGEFGYQTGLEAGWCSLTGFFADAIEPGDEPWQDSLQERPEGSRALGDLPEIVLSEKAERIGYDRFCATDRETGEAEFADGFYAALEQWKKEQQ